MQLPSDVQLVRALLEQLATIGPKSHFLGRFPPLEQEFQNQREGEWVASVLFDSRLQERLRKGKRLGDLLRGLPECALAAADRPDLGALASSVRRSILLANNLAARLREVEALRLEEYNKALEDLTEIEGVEHTEALRTIKERAWEDVPVSVKGDDKKELIRRGLPWLSVAILHRKRAKRKKRVPFPSGSTAGVPSSIQSIDDRDIPAAIAFVLAPGLHLVDLRELLEVPVDRRQWSNWLNGELVGLRHQLKLKRQQRHRETMGAGPGWNSRMAPSLRHDPWETASALLNRIKGADARERLLRLLHVGLRNRYKATANEEYARAALAVGVFGAHILHPRNERISGRFQRERAVRLAVSFTLASRMRGRPWSEALVYRRLRPLLGSGESLGMRHRIRYFELEFRMISLLIWRELQRRDFIPDLQRVSCAEELDSISIEFENLRAEFAAESLPSRYFRLAKRRMQQRCENVELASKVIQARSTKGLLGDMSTAVDAQGDGSPRLIREVLELLRRPRGSDPIERLVDELGQNRHEITQMYLEKYRVRRTLGEQPVFRREQLGFLDPWFWFMLLGVAAAERQTALDVPMTGMLRREKNFGGLAFHCLNTALLLCEEQGMKRVNFQLRALLGLDVRCATWQSADRTYLRAVRDSLSAQGASMALSKLSSMEHSLEAHALLAREYPNDSDARDRVVRIWRVPSASRVQP